LHCTFFNYGMCLQHLLVYSCTNTIVSTLCYVILIIRHKGNWWIVMTSCITVEQFIIINALTEWHTTLSEKLRVAYLLTFPAVHGPTNFVLCSQDDFYFKLGGQFSCFVALQLEKSHKILKHKSLCVFLISKELWLYRRVLYFCTLQTMYLGNSTCIGTELLNTIACPHFMESVSASECSGCCEIL
jgi:hypothetical protein